MPRLRPSDAAKRRERAEAPEFSEALARGIAVMLAFDAGRRSMSLSDVARAVDLPRATARRALHTLNRLGFVDSDGKQFSLTPKVLRLASTYLGANGTATILQLACERVSRTVDEACSAAALDGTEIVMIAHASPQRFSAAGPGIGFRLPAFCTSLGRVLVASFDDKALSAFLDRIDRTAATPQTVTDPTALKRRIASVRAQGYALVDQEAELGFRSIAVPLRRYDGTVVAALNVGARIERASPERMRADFLPLLLREAGELGRQIVQR